MVSITVVGSVNLDLVASCARLPVPGETIGGARFARHPGGKGANQALAARRLGAEVRLLARVGRDAAAAEALALLRRDGVDLSGCAADETEPTGVALIAVADSGENSIVVAPGANAALSPDRLGTIPASDALILQLEIPLETVTAVARRSRDWLCLNAAPATTLPAELLERVDLLVVNDTEARALGPELRRCAGLVAITHGARGAELLRGGARLAEARPPHVEVRDSTGAGDAFVAALCVALREGRPAAEALRFACAAGALATTRAGAQPSLPWRVDVERILRESAAAHSPEDQA